MSSYCRKDKTEFNSKCSSSGCMKPVDDHHRYFDFHSICCAVCNSSKHWSCHGLSKTDYLLIREMNDYPFICPSCRSRCDTNYRLKNVLEELINEKIGISIGQRGRVLLVHDVKVNLELALSLDHGDEAAEIPRKSGYDSVPSPVALEKNDVEPVYEVPKFHDTQPARGNEDDEASKICYYV